MQKKPQKDDLASQSVQNRQAGNIHVIELHMHGRKPEEIAKDAAAQIAALCDSLTRENGKKEGDS